MTRFRTGQLEARRIRARSALPKTEIPSRVATELEARIKIPYLIVLQDRVAVNRCDVKEALRMRLTEDSQNALSQNRQTPPERDSIEIPVTGNGHRSHGIHPVVQ
jgi:hypothetical protein